MNKDQPLTYIVSVTELLRWMDCRRRTAIADYMKSTNQMWEEEIMHVGTLIGILVHKGLEYFYNSDANRDIKEYKNLMIREATRIKSRLHVKFDTKSRNLGDAVCDAVAMVSRIAQRYDLRDYESERNVSFEMACDDWKGKLVIQGRLDYFKHTYNERAEIVEIKTSRHVNAQEQLQFYKVALVQEGYKQVSATVIHLNREKDDYPKLIGYPDDRVNEGYEVALRESCDAYFQWRKDLDENGQFGFNVVAPAGNPHSRLCYSCPIYYTIECPPTWRKRLDDEDLGGDPNLLRYTNKDEVYK